MRDLWFAWTQYVRFRRLGEGPRVSAGLACWHYRMARMYSNWIELGEMAEKRLATTEAGTKPLAGAPEQDTKEQQ